MNRRSRRNLKEISDVAKVSLATVSRVLNNRGYVSQKRRTRVLEAIRSLGYRQPPKKLVALIVPETSNPFFAQLGFMFERLLAQEGFHLLICGSDRRPERELEAVEEFRSLEVSGLVYISSGKHSPALVSVIAKNIFPVVVFDRKIPARNLDLVKVDSRKGTLSAVDYLAASGHRRIGYLKGLEGTDTARERFESFCEAMEKNGFAVREEWLFEGDYSLQAGRACAERLIEMSKSRRDERPTAILAANDLMAIGLLQKLQQEGWKLPADLSVIGFDNILGAEWVYPALTTIAQPIPKLVGAAVELLTQRIREMEGNGANCQLGPRVVELEPELIPRASVAEPYDHDAKPSLAVAKSGGTIN